MQIKVTYQGCAEAGLCYPPITKVLFPDSAAFGSPQFEPTAGRALPSLAECLPFSLPVWFCVRDAVSTCRRHDP